MGRPILRSQKQEHTYVEDLNTSGFKIIQDTTNANRLLHETFAKGNIKDINSLIKQKSMLKLIDTLVFSSKQKLSFDSLNTIIKDLLNLGYGNSIKEIIIIDCKPFWKISGKNIVTGFKKLKKLDISSNQLDDSDLWILPDNISNISDLNISFNKIGNLGAYTITKKMPNLVRLNIGYNDLTSCGAIAIAENLPNLTSLHIEFNNISNKGTISIADNLSKLIILNISLNNVDSHILDKTANNLKKLTDLNIGHNKFDNIFIKELKNKIAKSCKLHY